MRTLSRLLLVLVVVVPVAACGSSRPAFLEVRPPIAFEMLRDNPRMAVIDVRSAAEYAGSVGHISGSRNVPLDELGARLDELLPLRDQTFLVYCGHGECGRRAIEILFAGGFDEAILMDGGIDGWIVAGFGTVTGPAPPMEFGEEGEVELSVE
jgi:rhodanese-related sulfurtransferase